MSEGMTRVSFPAGMHVGEAARLLAAGAPAFGFFNDIELHAVPGATADAIVADFNQQSAERAASYRGSPEGIASAERAKQRVESAQATHDQAIAALAALDFSDAEAVLDWICGIQDATDTSGVKVDKNAILLAFAGAGFYPNVNCGKDFDGEDRDNHHRWLVGQALDTLSTVSIHPMVHTFADQWRKKFA